MSGAEEERRPLVYEDAEMLDQERMARRRRVWRVGGAVLLTGGLAIALCLAVALPLSHNGTAQASGGGTKPQLLQLIALPAPPPTPSKQTIIPPSTTITPKQAQPSLWTTPTRPAPSPAHLRGVAQGAAPLSDGLLGGVQGEPWGPRYDEGWITRWPTDHTEDDTTTRHHIFPSRTTPPPPPACPPIPSTARRGPPIDLAQLAGPDGLIEVARVQTFGSPGFVLGLACSTAQLNLTGAGTGVLGTSWEQGTLRHHAHHTETVALRAADTPNDWTFSVIESDTNCEGVAGDLSLLALLDDYLLAYTCYPQPQRGFDTGYVLSVWTRGGDERRLVVNWPLVEALLRVAAHWGLNPDELRPAYPPTRPCRGGDD